MDGASVNEVGIGHFKQGNIQEALVWFKKVLRIKNDIPDVYNNIATCYMALKQYKAAETTLKISLALSSTDAVHFSLGNLYFYTKQYELSIKHYQKVKTTECEYNLAFPYLALKQFKKGFTLYENRLKISTVVEQTNEPPRVEIPWIPYWDGNDYRHLLIIYEQGIGDNIQYFRFILELARKYPDRQITYFTKNIAHLFTSCANVSIVLQLTENIFDCKLYVMSLPFYLGIESITPLVENYINAPLIKKTPGLKIGFVHNGLLSSFIEKNIELSEWHIFEDVDATFYCLGKGVEHKGPANMVFVEDRGLAFEESVRILSGLDLFITVDTAIAHLAGVMQIKTWLLLGYGSDWRWFQDDSCPWYPSMEIIRMRTNNDMKELLPLVKEKIRKEF